MVALLALTLIPGVTLTGVKADKKTDRWVDPVDSFVPGRILVGFRSTISADHARQVIASLGARDADEIPGIGVHILDLPYQASEQVFQKAFQARPEVEFAELDRILPPDLLRKPILESIDVRVQALRLGIESWVSLDSGHRRDCQNGSARGSGKEQASLQDALLICVLTGLVRRTGGHKD